MKLKRLMVAAIEAPIVLMCKLGAFIFPQNHWILYERGTDARDNGYWFYKYLKDNHPEIKVFYLISKDSVDYPKVQADAVVFGTVKHYWLLVSAAKRISTHYAFGLRIPNAILFRFYGLHNNFYFLQHGITQNKVSCLNYKNAPMNMFVCGAKPEYEYILENFGHSPSVVQYTGLARFDKLHNFNVKHQILVMPTWRIYIKGLDDFLKSDYFSAWQCLLNNEKLIEYLEYNNYELIFYVHYEMQKYRECFSTTSDRIILAGFSEYDVQQLLKESAVLITDYSSVFFDFAYMKKPIVYYQFDEDDFHSWHYHKGYFDYRTMGFGDVCMKEAEVLESLCDVFYNNMQPSPEYLKRMDAFFPLHDTNNCQRIFDRIVKAGNEK